MNDSAVVVLIQNSALLIVLVYVHELLRSHHKKPWEEIPRRIMTGLILGCIGIAIMLTQWTFKAGIVFDTRSVLLAVSGLFFGTIPTAIAMAILAVFRIYQGGAGALPGVCVILASGLIGVGWRHLRSSQLHLLKWWELLGMGILVHVVMTIILLLTIPWPEHVNPLNDIFVPVMLIYPPATALMGILMQQSIVRQFQENRIAESEERHRTLFENNHTIMLLIDPENETLVDVNPFAANFYGYPREEMRGKPMTLICPGYDPAASKKMAASTTGETFRFSSKHKLADGSLRDVEVFTGPTVIDRKHLLHSIIHDITDRLKAEEEIRASHEKVEGLLEDTERARAALATALEEEKQTLIALRNSELRFTLLLDNIDNLAVQGYYSDGTIFYWNKASTRLYGYTREEAIGRDVVELICLEEKRQHHRDLIREMVETKRSIPASELVVKHKDGTSLHVFTSHAIIPVTGSQVELFAMDVDLSTLKLATMEIRKLTQAIEQSPVSIVITDTEGKIQYVNTQFSITTGYSLEEVEGRTQRFLDSGEKSDVEHEKIVRTLEAGIVWRGEFRNKRKDGATFWERVTISPMFDERGNIVNHLAVKEDITETKKLEDALRQSQKMQAVGRLAGGVAHDFNNMLGVILGYAELAREVVEPETLLHKQLTEIQRAALRSADLTRQLLAFARKQTIQPKVLDINESVTQMLKMLIRLIGEHINLVWKPCASPWPIRIDPSQLDQILANLSVNARDAIPDSGTVIITTENRIVTEEQASGELYPGEYVLLSVTDTGAGMPPEVLDHLFEPFYTTKEQGKGTGLGLPTVYGIVKQNHGYIDVQTRLGEGTRFDIYFPRSQPGEKDVTDEHESEPVNPSGSETIMIVEDELPILTLAESILNRYGFNVMAFTSPREAIEAAKGCKFPIDILVTDVILPEINGSELATEITTLFPKAKVLFMSGYTADVISNQGILPKDINFIQKPFRSHAFAIKVRNILDSPMNHDGGEQEGK